LADPIVFSNFSSAVMAFGGNFFASDVLGLFSPVGHFALTAVDSTGSAVSYQLDKTVTNSFLGFVLDAQLMSVSLSIFGPYCPTANNVTLAMSTPVPVTVPNRAPAPS
jgi:hypothetical protein